MHKRAEQKRVLELRDLPVVMVTGVDEPEIAAEALKIGAYDYIVKYDQYLETLAIAVEKAIAKHRLKLKGKKSHDKLRATQER